GADPLARSNEHHGIRPAEGLVSRVHNVVARTLAPPHDQDRRHPRVTFAVLALAGVSYALLQSLVAPALPEIQHALHTSEASVSWVLTSYLLSASVATPLIGRLGDMHGKERMLLIVLALLSVGTLISAFASSL